MLGDDVRDMPPSVRAVYERLVQARCQLEQLAGQPATLAQLQRIQVNSRLYIIRLYSRLPTMVQRQGRRRLGLQASASAGALSMYCASFSSSCGHLKPNMLRSQTSSWERTQLVASSVLPGPA